MRTLLPAVLIAAILASCASDPAPASPRAPATADAVVAAPAASPAAAPAPAPPATAASSAAATPSPSPYRPVGYHPGVNLAVAEFGKGDELGKTYAYPGTAEFAYFHSKGMRVVRIPFLWERVQPVVRGDLRPADVAELDRCVAQANQLGLAVLLDVHNYGGRTVAGKHCFVGMDAELSGADFNDLWVRLAKRYQDRPLVWFGLMNEPHQHSAQLNAQLMQAAVDAIRATGARNLITVPGTAYTGAHSWISSGNAAAFETFKDPGDNVVFEVHQYLDQDHSGSHAEAVPGAGAKRLTAFTAWAKAHHVRALLGETGWSQQPAAMQEGEAELAAMDHDRDVWLGFTYWAAGPWWGTYMYSLEPEFPKGGAPVDKPQMSVVANHLQ